MENTIVFPEGALVFPNAMDQMSLNLMKDISFNLAVLPQEIPYLLQEGITAELQPRESREVQVPSEQKINIEKLSLQHDELVSQIQQLVDMADDTYRCILELTIMVNLPVEVRIHSLVSGVHDTREEMKRVQLKMNLQITEIWLKVQPSTPPEIREKHANTIAVGLEGIGGAVCDCMNMLEHALEVLVTLQEDPNIQQLETEACELQQQYKNIRGTAQTVVLTQRLVSMQQSKVLKEQVDVAGHKEEILKAYVQPWIEEAFTIIVDIEGNLAQIQGMYAQIQGYVTEVEVLVD